MAKRNRPAGNQARPELMKGQQDAARFYEFGTEPGVSIPGALGRQGQQSQATARATQVSNQYSGARTGEALGLTGRASADQEAGLPGAAGTAGSPSYQKAAQQGAAEAQRFQKTKQDMGANQQQ